MASAERSAGTRLIERQGQGPALLVSRCRLTVVSGPDAGRAIDMDGASVVVGSDAACDLPLAHETLSRRHFELRMEPDGCRLRDLRSLNGTFVAGLRAVDVYLRNGTEITAGDITLRFEVLDDEVELELSRRTNFGGLLGHSPAMRTVFATLEQAAKTDATVLITGESGTGKELAARGLHGASSRKDGPYVVFDCAGAAPTLIEGMLFGHVKGAFTGASAARAGVFEEADGGTLVLDELGELPFDLQPKLLRALESKAVQRIGESKERPVDVRFVASTNRNLAEEVRAGRFREDLYYRLSVIQVHLPPLRERIDELPRLVKHFLGALGQDPSQGLAPSVMGLLSAHDWPGNVRELRNVIERLVTLPGTDPAMLIPSGSGPGGAGAPVMDLEAPFHEAKGQWNDRFERAYLEAMLERHRNNISELARAAGLSRQTCYRLLDKHGLRVTEES